MAVQTKAQRIAELESVLRLVHKDLLQRGTKEEDGGIVVDVGAGVWYRLCQTLKTGEPAKGKLDAHQQIPEHHKQWFEQLKTAHSHGRLALMACLDAETLEYRSVITLVGDDKEGGIIMTPVGHLCPKDNPFEAYLPPATQQETMQ